HDRHEPHHLPRDFLREQGAEPVGKALLERLDDQDLEEDRSDERDRADQVQREEKSVVGGHGDALLCAGWRSGALIQLKGRGRRNSRQGTSVSDYRSTRAARTAGRGGGPLADAGGPAGARGSPWRCLPPWRRILPRRVDAHASAPGPGAPGARQVSEPELRGTGRAAPDEGELRARAVLSRAPETVVVGGGEPAASGTVSRLFGGHGRAARRGGAAYIERGG